MAKRLFILWLCVLAGSLSSAGQVLCVGPHGGLAIRSEQGDACHADHHDEAHAHAQVDEQTDSPCGRCYDIPLLLNVTEAWAPATPKPLPLRLLLTLAVPDRLMPRVPPVPLRPAAGDDFVPPAPQDLLRSVILLL